MKNTNSNIKINLLIFILLLSVVSTINQGFKPSDQNVFENPNSSAGEISINSPENITYIEPMSGYYPGTFDFENEIAGNTGVTIEYVDYATVRANCEIKIYDEFQGHNKVFKLHDGSTTQNILAQNYFDTPFPESGTIEWWWSTDISGTNNINYDFLEGTMGTRLIRLKMLDGNFVDWEGTIVQSYLSNQWYHNKIVFDTVSDTYDWYIDGIKQVDGNSFENPVDNIGSTDLKGGVIYTGSCYLDAIGYSWDPNYNPGDNLNEGLLLGYNNITTLDWQGYSLDGASNRTILGNTTIPIPADGHHKIQVFGNDSIGNMYESDVRYFTVVTSPPEITINSPTHSQTIGSTAPSYDISITGFYDSIWYILDGGATNHSANSLTGTLNQAAWTALADGIITITFFANNSAGMEESAQVQVIKDTSEETPPGIPGYDLYLLIGALSVISAILIQKRLKS
ncbi:MAG: Loki-CTERM sorting domain-containing protein [Promethearchaeota archaeon]